MARGCAFIYRRLREERVFADAAELARAIGNDVQQARDILAGAILSGIANIWTVAI